MNQSLGIGSDELMAGFAGSRCLVTGGAGFIGSNLVRTLLEAGVAVTVLDNMSTGSPENLPPRGVRLIRGDVATFPQLAELVRDSDYVFHLAAQVGNVKSLDHAVSDALTNIVGTVRLLEAGRNSSVRRIVYSSSSAIFGEAEHLPIDESHPQRPASFYALSKQTGEKYALLASSLWQLPVVCLRYFNVYGYPSEDSDYSGVISIFFRRLAERQPLLIYGDGEQSRDFVYVLDVVQAIMRAALLGTPGEVYNVGTGRATTIGELAAIVAETAGQTAEIEKRDARAGEVRHSVASIAKAGSELGFAPRYDLPSGLVEYRALIHGAAQRPATADEMPAAGAEPSAAARLLVLVQTPEEAQWLQSFRFGEYGFEPVFLEVTEQAHDFAQIVSALKKERPVACLTLTSGVSADLLRLACEIESVSTFSVIATGQEFTAIPIADPSPPHVFFLATNEVLIRALPDPRYGRTLIPSGHPADGNFIRRPADVMLSSIRSFVQGENDDERPDLSVIIPAYKEASNLALVCDRLLRVFETERISTEIILVDDSSPDTTYEVALEQMWKSSRIRAFTKPPPRGMGNAIRYGIERARAPVLAVTMGDGSDQVERLPDMYRKITTEGYGLVIGSRYRFPENYEAVPRLYRFWSRCFRLTAWAVVGVKLSDYTNAFRMFDRRVFARYGAESGGFEISPEITFKAWFATGRVGEVDVRHLKRASGQSNFSFLRAGPGYGKILAKALVNRATGRWFTLDW